MQIIRGTTPKIVINVKSDIDLTQVVAIWIYISQNNKVKVDKQLSDVVLDANKKTIALRFEQEDTLDLKAGEALFQIRLLLQDTNALATIAQKITIIEVYKGGVISE